MYRVGRAAVVIVTVMVARPRASYAQADTPAAAPLGGDSSAVVVGPLGIRMRERALGVAYQTLRGAELADAREPNIVSALAGKVAGADVTNNGTTNGSVHITLRGESLLTGDDQPLFVVDGVPIDNSRPARSADGGIDYGNTVEDIDPNDIASVTVLPGANATALYGSRAQNGAIVITTKTARGTTGFALTASQYFTFETPLRLPALQNEYGQGAQGQYGYVDGRGGGVSDDIDENWGPPLDGQPIVQWRSNGQPAPWLARPNNLRDFFDLGHTATTTAAVTAAGSAGDIRLGISSMGQHGMLPNNTLRRTTASLAGGSTMLGKLTTRISLRYARDDGHDRPVTGYSVDNPITSFIFGGRQLDPAQLRDYALVDGAQAFPTPQWENNPFWDVYANTNADSRDHVTGVASVAYAITPWLSAMVRTGTDWYHDRWVQQSALGDVNVPAGMARASTRHFRENNTDVLLNGSHDLTPAISLSVNAGAARREGSTSEANYLEMGGVDPFPAQTSAFGTKHRTTSAYGQAQLGYRNYLFLTATGRNDWTSFGLVPHTSNFYPSVSSAFVFTDAVPGTRMNGLLSYGKLRLSWAQVGGEANGLIVAKRTTSWEGGLDLGFARDRVKVSGTYYDARTLNRLFAPGPPGYIGPFVPDMDGSMTSRGLELQVMATPVRRANFTWDVSLNFAKDRSRVASLPAGMRGVVLADAFYTEIAAQLGDPYGTLIGQTFRRDSLGRMIVANGLPVASATLAALGHYSPDWIGGLENQFHYKQFDISVLLDTKQGGKIFSGTEMFGDLAGTLASSLHGRERGETVGDGGGLIVPGVNEDGTPNTTTVTAQSYFNSLYAMSEAYVYDASFIKLREVRLGYTVPERLAARLRLASVRLAAIGRNLWLSAKAPDIDPEATFANGDGNAMEFLSVPSARSYGLVLNVTP